MLTQVSSQVAIDLGPFVSLHDLKQATISGLMRYLVSV